jgi:myo-inositol-1(or 4)-monophosphatase
MNLDELTEQVCLIAKKTGAFLLEENKKISAQDIETKSKNSLVTYVDKSAEKQIIEALTPLIPEAGFIAEEGTSDKTGDTYNWVIDPLDGTTNYIHGLPIYCVSIGLLKGKNELLVGVIYEPNLDECFYARKDGGAYLNGKPIQVSETDKIENSLFATGFPYYDYHKMDGYLKVLKDLMFNSRGIRRLGSAAVDLAYVACGRFEAFYEYSLNPWDVAAGALIVKEAGGVVYDFRRGKDYIFGKEIIASTPKVYESLQTFIDKDFQND